MVKCSIEDFVIPYQRYMKSITRPEFIGAKVHEPIRILKSLKRKRGVVTGMADLDPKNWPNSKWKCLKVTWKKSSFEVRVSPWEIVFDSSRTSTTKHKESKLQRPRTSTTKYKESKPKKLQTSQQDNSSHAPHLEKRKDLLSDETIRSKKQKHVQEPGSIHCEADTTNHPFDIQKQTPAPQTSSQLTLCPDLCSLASFFESKSTTNYEELKISNCSVDDLWRHLKENHAYEYLEFDSCSFPSPTRIPIPVTIKKLKITNCSVNDLWRHLKENHSYEYLEFDSCSFPSPTRIPIPVAIKKLKITNCVDTEQVFTVLMDPNLSVESLEIDSCSSFSSMSTGGIPSTLRQLKIVNCVNLKSFSASFETEKSPSINEGVHYSMADILELRELEIQNCLKLESLPKGMHKLRNLDLLSIQDCCSLEYFPEGGLPITCLTSLKISGCENLKCLPNELHKVTSLQNLSISGCPSLKFFPEGGLPPNLVSLRILDCENLISLPQWELHKLKHLRKYSFRCGCSDSRE